VVNNNMPTNTAMAAASDKNTVRITLTHFSLERS
jgi:hypothetical protein